MSSKREQRAARAECTVQLPDDLKEKAARDAARVHAIAETALGASPLIIHCDLEKMGLSTPHVDPSPSEMEAILKSLPVEDPHCFKVIMDVEFLVDCRGNVDADVAAGARKYAAELIAFAERLEAEAEADRGR